MTTLLQRLRPDSAENPATITVEDAVLVAEAQADLDAFAAIYNRHLAGIYGYCYRALGSADRAWGSFGGEDGQFRKPIGVDVDAEGNLYVIDDERDDVQKFDGEGNFLLKFAGHGSDEGQLNFTGWGSVDPEGNLWVADAGNDRVQQFAPDGTFLQSIDGSGRAGGELDNPQVVAVDAQGRVFVADTDNRRVQVFDAAGQFLVEWTGDDADGTRFANTGFVGLDGAGNVYVADFSEAEGYEAVQKFRLLPPLT